MGELWREDKQPYAFCQLLGQDGANGDWQSVEDQMAMMKEMEETLTLLEKGLNLQEEALGRQLEQYQLQLKGIESKRQELLKEIEREKQKVEEHIQETQRDMELVADMKFRATEKAKSNGGSKLGTIGDLTPFTQNQRIGKPIARPVVTSG